MRSGRSILVALLASVSFASAQSAQVAPSDPKQVQAAVDAGIRWLAAHQVADGPEAGSWGNPRYGTAVASFAGLALLANGHLPGEGEYGKVVDRAMRYVQASMTPEGYLGAQGDSMYVHAICTLFGLSYLGMSPDPTHDKEMAAWCRKSIDLILAAQKVPKPEGEQGGWRYTPGSAESDVSVTSWQLLALHAARQCGYEIDPQVFTDALKYIDSAYVEEPGGAGGFVYRPGVSKSPEPGVTGAALFVKCLLESEQDEKSRKSRELLQRFNAAWGGDQYKGYFYFGTFYMAQGLFQLGDEEWRAFIPQLQRLLLDHQSGDGSWEFPPDNRVNDANIGPAYSTALAILLLSLDKQYLPMYQRQAALYR